MASRSADINKHLSVPSLRDYNIICGEHDRQCFGGNRCQPIGGPSKDLQSILIIRPLTQACL